MKSFPGNWIVKNLVLAAVIGLAIVLAASLALRILTKHNHVIQVPDFTAMSVQEAEKLASESGVRLDVVDSVFVRRMERGAIYRQEPPAGNDVKLGRRIMVTINAVTPRKVTMPNVVGCSMRQAKAELLARGLKLGRLIYVSDMATNNVLKQFKGGTDIRPGTEIDSDTVIDLVVGLSGNDNTTTVPKVTGMKGMTATDLIHDYSLNIRNLVYDDSVKNYTDSLNAVVYRQSPNPAGSVYIGSDVTLYLTTYEERMPK